ncbi:hypothetical protein COI81_28865 [Bacillus cereus]|nr:hypothetical protein COI81_28865 [Bacillus cereus]
MKPQSYEINVDTQKSINHSSMEFSQNNLNISELIFNITEDEKVFPLNDTDKIIVYFKKPDKTVVFQDKEIEILDKAKGKIKVLLTSQTLVRSGDVQGELSIERVENGTKKRANTYGFSFKVRSSIASNESLESTNEFQVFDKIIKVGEKFEDFEEEDFEGIIEAGAKAETALVKATENTNQIGILSNNVTATKTEVQTARTEKIPSTRLDTSSDASKIKQIHLSDEVKQMMAGNTPVNATPADRSVTKEKLADESVTPDKVKYKGALRNKGTIYPFKALTRDSVLSPEVTMMNDAILDARVIGAKKGKIYRIEWLGNGTTAFGAANYEILISEYDAATFATNSAVSKRDVIKLKDIPFPAPASNIETKVLTADSGKLTFVLTMDYSLFTGKDKLAINDATKVGTSGDYGYTHIIDPTCYIYEVIPTQLPVIKQNLLEYDATNHYVYAYSKYGSADDIMFMFRKLTINQLMALYRVYTNPSTSLSPVAFNYTAQGVTSIANGQSDWIGPYIIRAVDNGDGSAEQFTGGAHSTDNNSTTGNPTAQTISYQVFADGKRVTTSGQYPCDRIEIFVRNKIMSYNTKTTGRYTHEENVKYTIVGNRINVSVEIIPYEKLSWKTYYGLQATTNYYTHVFYPLGQYTTEQAVTNVNTSAGNKNEYRVDTVTLTKTGTTESLEFSIDNTVGLGQRIFVDNTNPLAFTSDVNKAYMRLIGDTEKMVNVGEVYSWKGSYCFRK